MISGRTGWSTRTPPIGLWATFRGGRASGRGSAGVCAGLQGYRPIHNRTKYRAIYNSQGPTTVQSHTGAGGPADAQVPNSLLSHTRTTETRRVTCTRSENLSHRLRPDTWRTISLFAKSFAKMSEIR